jgi:outer membrane protein TolC
MKRVFFNIGTNSTAIGVIGFLIVVLAPAIAFAQNGLPRDQIGLEVSSGVRAETEYPLSLAEAVQIAIMAEEPSVQSFDLRRGALEDRAIADAQLPDPMARVALANMPTDSFRFGQEPMTQAQVGLRQEFPRGNTLKLNGQRRRTQADAERAKKELALRQIMLGVRSAWFDRIYFVNAQSIVRENRNAVNELIDALSASFATGNLTSQDIFRAELELALLDDRLADLHQREERAGVELARYIGGAAERPVILDLPDPLFPASLQESEARLVRHPAIRVDDAIISSEEVDIALAEEAYRPSWGLEAGYGLRGGGRPDFATLGVSISIPLFTDRRQDRNLSAAIKERGAAKFDRSAKLLDLRRDLGRAYADWMQFEQRIDLYGTVVRERASEAAEASIITYANRLTDFPELIRSQLAELDVELKHFELRTARAKTWAILDYLAGEQL